MSEQKPVIMVVDDSVTDIQLMLETLKRDYRVLVATSGQQAFDKAHEPMHRPKVVLLDVAMPEMDGYETCQKFKSDPVTADIEVIFVSANDHIKEKSKGYAMGASDYLTKPVLGDELLHKVKMAVERDDARHAYDEQNESALETAKNAISDAGELASVVHFLRRSFHCHTVESLAQLIVSTSNDLGLHNSVQIRSANGSFECGSTMPVPPLEKEMLTALKDAGRINERGKRMLLNYDYISQIVKNMPVENEEKCGRLRDNLLLILEGANSRLESISMRCELEQVMNQTRESMERMQQKQAEQKEASYQVVNAMQDEIQTTFLDNELTEEQENALLEVVSRHADKVFETYDKGLAIDEEFEHIVSLMESTIQQHAKNVEQKDESASSSNDIDDIFF